MPLNLATRGQPLTAKPFKEVNNDHILLSTDILFLLQFFEAHHLREILGCEKTEVRFLHSRLRANNVLSANDAVYW